jgi:hypothetical protein
LRHLPHRQLRQDLPLLRRVRGPESATTGRIPVTTSLALPKLPVHAVFISGLPKLPCRNPSGCPSVRSTRIMSLDIKHLARQVPGPVWHPTCIRKGRRQQGFRSLEFEALGVRCVSVCRQSGCRVASESVVLGDAIKNHGTRPFRRAGAQPPNAPQLGGSLL